MQWDSLGGWRALSVTVSCIALGCVGQLDESDEPSARESSAAADVADTYAITSEGRVLFFENATGYVQSAMDLVGLGDDDALVGADFRPADGKLYALARSGKLYTFDLRRAGLLVRSSLVADPADTSNPFTGLSGEAFGVNFNPVADRLRIVSSSGQNLRVDVDTGATITDGDLPPTASIGAASYSNSFADACRTQLFVVDASTGELFLQDPPNDGALGRLGAVPAPGAGGRGFGLEIVTSREGRSSAIAYFPADEGADLYEMDIRTGALSNGRTLPLDSGEYLLALSAPPPAVAPPQALGEMLAVTESNRLISFNRAAPGKLCTEQDLEGLEANERVLGMDVRPADGDLYAVGSSGSIYTIDTATALATLRSTLRADASDTSDPFRGLDPRGSYGVAFNPIPDRLRVVSSTGWNLRINVDTGVTNTDAPLSPSSLPAVAYTNAVAGATSTTLYAIDSGRGALTVIGGNPATTGACPDDVTNPNCGVVTDIGMLGMASVSEVGGFDIDASATAERGWLALTLAPSATSKLYVVDLASGAVAPPPGVADPTIGGGEVVRGLTLLPSQRR